MTTAMLCAHHWDIERANGHMSKGTCLKCGETKDFLNAVPEDGEYHFEVAHSKPKKEWPVKEKRLLGGDVRARAKVLKPARRAAEELFGEGKDIHDVKAQLYATFGDIALSTITGWKQRMKPVTHKEAIPKPARSHTETTPRANGAGRGIQILIDMLPADGRFDPPLRKGLWRDAFNAMFELIYS